MGPAFKLGPPPAGGVGPAAAGPALRFGVGPAGVGPAGLALVLTGPVEGIPKEEPCDPPLIFKEDVLTVPGEATISL